VEIDSEATTVSGWVIERSDGFTSEGDTFDYENLHVEVTSTDGRRCTGNRRHAGTG
jgi:CBS domain containing-hemolysin-like protein